MVYVSDVFTEGTERMATLSDDKLQQLSQDIPDILYSSRAESTNHSYGLAYKKWRLWASAYPEVLPLPAQANHVLLYLVELEKQATSFSILNLAVCAIKWAHSMAGLDSPTDSILIKEALLGFKRRLAQPTIRKEPFTKEQIMQIIDVMDVTSLADVRNTALIVLAFFGLLRVSELRALKAQDIQWLDDHIVLHIRKSKCDQLRSGDKVYIARLGGKYCPILVFDKYIEMSGMSTSDLISDDFIFRRVIPQHGSFKLALNNIAMTYSRIRDVVKLKAEQIGLSKENFSTHSMRSGGATAAANANVDDRILQRHGRWATACSKNRYVKDDVSHMLSISKVIGF